MFFRSSVTRRLAGCGLLAVMAVSAHPGSVAAEQPATMDPRVATYAQRQAIRDQYRGQIDVLTFNDELGDGAPLDQAVADALNATHFTASGSMAR